MSLHLGQSEAPAQEPSTLPAAWNPFGIGLLGFFFSILPAGILQAINYARLGAPQRVYRVLALNLTASGIVFAAAWLTSFPRYLFFVFNLLSISYFAESQRELYRLHLSRGGPKASFRRPIVLSVAGWLLVVLLFIGSNYYMFRRDEGRFNQAIQLMKVERYQEAEVLLKKYQLANPDDIASYWNLALMYVWQGDTELAIGQLRTAVSKDPSDTDARAFLRNLLPVPSSADSSQPQ
jgi:tetratricopeptide (TPR) repeat protein